MRTLAVMIIGSVMAIGTGASQAAPNFVGSAVGDWQNLQAAGSGNVDTITNHDASLNGTANFSFGVGISSPPNSFSFNGAGSDPSIAGFNAPANTSFDIGQFKYFNGTTDSFPQFSTIDLGIALTLTSPIMTASTFAYDFAINLTPNTTGNPAADGDIVTIANGLTSRTFVIGITTYTLQLLGFSTNGGTTFTSSFLSPEGTTASADIYAMITTNVLPVPEPGTLALLGAGLFGIGLIVRTKRA